VLALFVLGVPIVFGTHPKIFGDGDVSWHIAAGQWMIEHRQIPMVDPFSFSAFGKPWIAHEWLSEILMAAAFSVTGYTGLAVLVAASLSLTFLIVGRRLARWARPVELCAALMVAALVLYPFILARPMVFVWPILAWWTDQLLRAREENRLPTWWLVPMMVLWVNLHASFALGIGLVGVFALEALVESKERLQTLLRWSVFGLATTAAALFNPHGVSGLLLPLTVFSSKTVHIIREFNPTDFTTMPMFEVALMLLIGISLWRGVRLHPVRLILVLGMLHLALAHIRHQTLFMIIATMVAVPPMTTAWMEKREFKEELLKNLTGSPSRGRLAGWAVAAVIALTLCARFLWPVAPAESDVNATTAFAHIPTEFRNTPVLNEYSFGGPLILRGIKVFMDGRTDVYGDSHFLQYLAISRGDRVAFAKADRQWRFCWAIFPPDNKAIIALFDQSPDWRRIYSDKFAIIHVRPGCAGSPR
ncbi:MAG: hypothetical protein ABIO43_08900, partial [Sphingomicrobium sp.]